MRWKMRVSFQLFRKSYFSAELNAAKISVLSDYFFIIVVRYLRGIFCARRRLILLRTAIAYTLLWVLPELFAVQGRKSHTLGNLSALPGSSSYTFRELYAGRDPRRSAGNLYKWSASLRRLTFPAFLKTFPARSYWQCRKHRPWMVSFCLTQFPGSASAPIWRLSSPESRRPCFRWYTPTV